MYLFDLELLSFPDICPGVGLQDHIVTLFLVSLGTCILFSIVAAPIYISTNSRGGVPFLQRFSEFGEMVSIRFLTFLSTFFYPGLQQEQVDPKLYSLVNSFLNLFCHFAGFKKTKEGSQLHNSFFLCDCF